MKLQKKVRERSLTKTNVISLVRHDHYFFSKLFQYVLLMIKRNATYKMFFVYQVQKPGYSGSKVLGDETGVLRVIMATNKTFLITFFL